MARRPAHTQPSSKPFDATTKVLVELRPADWLALAGLPVQPVTVIDADLATVTTDADRVLRVGDPPSFVLHIEFESGKSTANIGDRTLRYNVLLDAQQELPVQSVVVLLRRASNSPRVTGRVERFRPDGSRYLLFEYTVIRVWEIDVERLLTGGLGTLPLAPLANVSEDGLTDVVQRMDSRIQREAATSDEAALLWSATYVLMGLKYSAAFATQLLRGIEKMRESTTYQAILAEGEAKGRAEGEAKGRAEGRADEARSLILKIGTRRFGAPDTAVRERITAITDVARLEALADRLLEAENWAELLSEG